MSVHERLAEWVQVFLQNRDVFNKVITGFEKVNGDLLVKRTNGDLLVFVRPELGDVSDVSVRDGPSVLAVLNSKRNLDAVIKNWDVLAKKKDLCVYFVNPETNDKWLLYPHTHNQITEKSALRRGLESLFAMVPPV
jgi:hypothetical protein